MLTRGKAAVTVAGAVAVGALLVGGPATGRPRGGIVHVYEDDALTNPKPEGPVILRGAIQDHGTDHEGLGPKHTINKLVLTKGSFEVDVSKLNVRPRMTGCSMYGKGTAPVSIVKRSGTGAYAGIAGKTEATLTLVGAFTPNQAGACNSNSRLATGFAWVTATGRVSFR